LLRKRFFILLLKGLEINPSYTIPPIRIENGSDMNGKTIKELEEQGIFVQSILDEGRCIIPPRDRIIKQNDVVLLQFLSSKPF